VEAAREHDFLSRYGQITVFAYKLAIVTILQRFVSEM
jgi:hypothetical protein